MAKFWQFQAVLLAGALAVGLLLWNQGSESSTNVGTNLGANAAPADGASVAGTTITSPLTTGATGLASATTIPVTTLPPPTTTSAPPARTAMLAFTGDLLPHASVQRQADANVAAGYDFGPMFDEVRPILSSADLALCHLETPLSVESTNLSSYPVFNSPGELAQNIADAGYDGCSLASNHSYDKRRSGVEETITMIERAGLGWAGTARDAAAQAIPRLYEVNGITIAHLSYTYGLNGFVLPGDSPYLVNVIDPEAIEAEAGRARAAGAEFVVLSMHWGAEYQLTPSTDQVALVDRLLPHDDIDLIVGHHAHVVQPFDRRGDEVVVYGLGNFLSNQSANCCKASTQDGMIAMLRIQEQPEGGFVVAESTYVATWVDRSDYTVLPVNETLAAGTTRDGAAISGDLRGVLEVSRGRTQSAIVALGADAWGARPADNTWDVLD